MGSLATAQVVSVRAEQKISDTAGGFGGVLDAGGGSDSDDGADQFGSSVTSLGDLDGDGIDELAVAAFCDDDGGIDQGAVWILFLNADGTVASEQKISATAGGFGGRLDFQDYFGHSVAALGSTRRRGLDLAVGAYRDDDGGRDKGAVWRLFLDVDTIARRSRRK